MRLYQRLAMAFLCLALVSFCGIAAAQETEIRIGV